MKTMKNYEEDIERLTKQKTALNEELNDIMEKRHIQKHLVSCNKEGHVWTLVGVKSAMWEIGTVHLLCTRCSAECITDGGMLGWKESNTEELIELLAGE